MANEADAELIERAKSDADAFGKLYEKHYSKILNYIYRRTLNVSTAEELTSNTFFKALRALPKYRRKGSFSAWLYRIATNEIKMHWRSESKRESKLINPVMQEEIERIYFAAPEAEAKEEIAEKMKKFCELNKILKELPEKYETVLHLRYFEKLQINEIAGILGKRIGTVKSLIHRGLKRLRRRLENEDATF